VYRAAPRYYGLAVVALAGAIAGATTAVLLPSARWPALFLTLLFGALGTLLLASLKIWHIMLFEDAIELVELGRKRCRIATEEIAGRRTFPIRYGMVLHVFEFRDRGRKPAKVSLMCKTDSVLRAWLAAIPDLDEVERARAEAAVLSSVDYGPDVPARRAALARARMVVQFAGYATSAVSLWAYVYPRPYSLVIATLVVLPLAAIALLLAGRKRYKITGRDDARPSLSLVILSAGWTLMLRAIFDYRLVEVWRLLAGTAIAAVLLLVVLAVGDPGIRRGRFVTPVVITLLLLAPYSWGALAAANALLDDSPAELFQTTVHGKHVVVSNRTTYSLQIAGWLPRGDGNDVYVNVDRDLYEAVRPGDPLCMALRPGALGARWFDVQRC
jgi:hypothetical protein